MSSRSARVIVGGQRVVRAVAVAFLCLGLGCTAPRDESDPFESFNRPVHHFNETLDSWVLRPVAVGYRDSIPGPVRERVHNALTNLRHPATFANDILQGEWKRGGVTLMRFLINSTWGLAGLHDVAGEMGFEAHTEDFGQTLAVAGVDSGPYLVLPLMGPSNVRDALGRVVDWASDPIRLLAQKQGATEGMYVRTVAEVIDERTLLIDTLDDLRRTSLDTYVSYKALYNQYRERDIHNRAAGDVIDTPSFDFDEFDESP